MSKKKIALIILFIYIGILILSALTYPPMPRKITDKSIEENNLGDRYWLELDGWEWVETSGSIYNSVNIGDNFSLKTQTEFVIIMFISTIILGITINYLALTKKGNINEGGKQ